MDIKAKVDEIVKKITSDKDLAAKFQSNPTQAVEGLIGVDLPDDQVQGVVEAVKTKIGVDSVMDKIGGLFNK